MPTDLPARSLVQPRSDDWANWQSLLVSAALAALLLLAVEARVGMFDGMTLMESLTHSAGSQYLIDGIDPNWASSPPL
jgi:hypothetical protein